MNNYWNFILILFNIISIFIIIFTHIEFERETVLDNSDSSLFENDNILSRQKRSTEPKNGVCTYKVSSNETSISFKTIDNCNHINSSGGVLNFTRNGTFLIQTMIHMFCQSVCELKLIYQVAQVNTSIESICLRNSNSYGSYANCFVVEAIYFSVGDTIRIGYFRKNQLNVTSNSRIFILSPSILTP